MFVLEELFAMYAFFSITTAALNLNLEQPFRVPSVCKCNELLSRIQMQYTIQIEIPRLYIYLGYVLFFGKFVSPSLVARYCSRQPWCSLCLSLFGLLFRCSICVRNLAVKLHQIYAVDTSRMLISKVRNYTFDSVRLSSLYLLLISVLLPRVVENIAILFSSYHVV